MRLLEEQLPTLPNIVQFAAYRDLRHARPVNTAFIRKLRLFKKDEEIDEDYKSVLLCLLTSDPHKKKKDKDAVTENKKRSEAFTKQKAKVNISEHNEGCNAEENDSQNDLFLKYLKEHDESYVLEYEKNLIPVNVRYEGDVDPQKAGDSEREPRRKSSGGRNKGKYSLKEDDRLSQKNSENYFDKNDVVRDPECIRPNPTVKVKVDQYLYVDESHNVGNEKTYGVNDSKNQVLTMLNRASSKRKLGPSNPIRRVGGSTSHVKPDPKHLFGHKDVRFGGDIDVSMRKGHTSINDKINDEKSGFLVKNPKSTTDRKSRIKTENEECRLDRNVKFQDDNYDDMQSSKAPNQRKQRGTNFVGEIKRKLRVLNQTESSTLRKSRNIAPNVCVEKCSPSEFRRAKSVKHLFADKDIDSSDAERCSSGEFRSAKAAKLFVAYKDIDGSDAGRCSSDEFGRAKSAKRFVVYKDIDSSDAEKCSSGEFRRAKAAKQCMAYKDIDDSYAEKEIKIESDSDVEIIDEAAFLEKDIVKYPSTSSNKCAKSMKENAIERIGRRIVSDEFRERLLNVLKKPFDKEEYKGHLEAVRGGNYFVYHPDLAGKLKKHRYNKGKRLNILRGFFFWLQYLNLEGSFKPWKDGRCLAVEPPPKP